MVSFRCFDKKRRRYASHMTIFCIGRDSHEVKPRHRRCVLSEQGQNVTPRTRWVQLHPFDRKPEVNDSSNELERIDVKAIILRIRRFTSLVDGLHAEIQVIQVSIYDAPHPRNRLMKPSSNTSVRCVREASQGRFAVH
jgi:hypothetical protein